MDELGIAIGVLVALLAAATFATMIWAAHQVDGRPHGELHLPRVRRRHARKGS